MNDLHSLAYTDTYHNSSLGWDYHHNNGVLNIDRISLMPTAMNESAISLFSSPQEYCDDDFSTGYLEDALIEFTSKRRRLLQPCSDEQRNNSNDDFGKSFWNFNFNPIWNHQPVENFYCMNHIERIFGLSETRTPEETKISESESPNSSSSSYKEALSSKTIQVNLLTRDSKLTSPGTSGYYEKRRRRRRIVYPFAMVKPGGIEGDVTLKDINERMLMAPTRPVKHPVGDFACQPCVSSLQGSGLSGKAVVTLTRIHTLGRRGTITIIRTKG
ncbi:hypothetical protein TanjilG_25367 [Lupinus angustifolius]|uniref:Protein XRI1 n=1 Tax=Lupinus angustifolius TaxID=3871 RepID=A0A4P1RV22_LUPAN|nr:PREDICTED: uncharacterized protein LOC109351227 [Lupinus angustifolius]OIW18924.1 hypothetical protein TanjilG_25367 [Lupinus angustifolius]